MKKMILLLFLLPALSTTSCNNNSQGIEYLPLATQTGENTFGCLLDDEVFLPSGGTNPLDCVYQFVSGGYYFDLQGNKRDNDNNLLAVACSTNNLEIAQNQTNSLLGNSNGNAFGRFTLNTSDYITSQSRTGELIITKLDTENQIASNYAFLECKIVQNKSKYFYRDEE